MNLQGSRVKLESVNNELDSACTKYNEIMLENEGLAKDEKKERKAEERLSKSMNEDKDFSNLVIKDERLLAFTIG